ncbi:MAG: hypothetical protein RBR71_13360, partial [Gudongella sp.]|nr:hypothetical protein [Gudongella sp.]
MVSDWMVAVNDYISDYSGVYSDVTIKDRRRRLVRIGRTISALRSAGRISTTDPGRFTVEDAKQIMISFRSRKDITPNTIMDLQGAINRFCRYHGNSCFEDARYRYPVLYNKKQYVRLPVLTHQDFRDLMFYLSRPGQSYNDLRGSAAVS